MLRYLFDRHIDSIRVFADTFCCSQVPDNLHFCFTALQFVHTYQKRSIQTKILCLPGVDYTGDDLIHYFTNVAEELVETIAIIVCSIFPDLVVHSEKTWTPGICRMFFLKINRNKVQRRINNILNRKVYMTFTHFSKVDMLNNGLNNSEWIVSLSHELDVEDVACFHALRWKYYLQWLFLWFREYADQRKKLHPLDKKDLATAICSFL